MTVREPWCAARGVMTRACDIDLHHICTDGGAVVYQGGALHSCDCPCHRPYSRYKTVFTPVGWQVVDTMETRDPVAEFGTGSEEYARAKEAAKAANSQSGTPE